MPDVMLPASFVALLSEFRPLFTERSFHNFVVLCCGFVHALGKHYVSSAIRAAASSSDKHYSCFYRFFSRAQWSVDDLGLTLLALVIKAFPSSVVELVLDDTLVRRTGKKVALATVHADPLLKMGSRCFMSYGHVFVVLSVHVTVPLLGPTGWALPFMFRLYEGPKQGGRKDSPSDTRRAMSRRRKNKGQRNRQRLTDRKVVDGKVKRCKTTKDTGPMPKNVRPTKLQLAAQMILIVAERFPNVRFRVLADHLYCGRDVLHVVHDKLQHTSDNVSFILRGRPDAALYELPPPKRKGQKGRPRVKGAKLPKPTEWIEQNSQSLQAVEVQIYGSQVPMLLGSYTGMAYRSLPGRLVRYVISRDPDGVYKDDFIVSTDPELSASEIIEAFSRRWPLERTFQDCKQKLGLQDPQVQLPASVRRVAPIQMILYSLVVFWYVLDGHRLASELVVERDPWYQKNARPSFTEMLASLRRIGWAEPFLDPPSQDSTRSKILASYIARVVAAA